MILAAEKMIETDTRGADVSRQHRAISSLRPKALSQRFRLKLAIVDIQLLDHFVIAKGKPFSFAASLL